MIDFGLLGIIRRRNLRDWVLSLVALVVSANRCVLKEKARAGSSLAKTTRGQSFRQMSPGTDQTVSIG